MHNIPYLGFIIFLIVYSYLKYTAVPQLMGQPEYILTTGLVVVMTAIVPYFASLFIGQQIKSNTRYVVAGGLPLLLSALGLAIYFYLFIAPNAPGMSVIQVLPRAIVPGLLMGALLLPLFMISNASPTR